MSDSAKTLSPFTAFHDHIHSLWSSDSEFRKKNEKGIFMIVQQFITFASGERMFHPN